MKNGRQRVDLGQLSPPQDHDVALCMYRRARSFHVIYACCVRSWSHQNRDPACMVRYTRRRLRLAQPPMVHAPCPLEATACVSLPRFPVVNPTFEPRTVFSPFFTRNGPPIVLMDGFNVAQMCFTVNNKELTTRDIG